MSIFITSGYEGINYELFNLALQRKRVMAANSGCSEGWNSGSISSSVGASQDAGNVIGLFLMDHIASSVHRLFTFPTSPSKILLLSLLLVHILDLVRDTEYPATRLAASRPRFAADGAT